MRISSESLFLVYVTFCIVPPGEISSVLDAAACTGIFAKTARDRQKASSIDIIFFITAPHVFFILQIYLLMSILPHFQGS